jgi:hypothetical protein
MTSTMLGQMAGGASLGEAFQAGLKAGASSAMTAGILNAPAFNGQSINQYAGIQDVAGTGSRLAQYNVDNVSQNLLGMTGRGIVNASVGQLIYGKDAGGFASTVGQSIVGDLAAVGANAIGQKTDILSLNNIAAHTVLGGAAAKLTGQDATAGAIGGAVSAVVNPLLDPLTTDSSAQARALTHTLGSMTVAGLTAEATGHDALTAARAALNETQNNWLSPKEKLLRWRADNACNNGNAGGCQTVALLNKLDASRETTTNAKFAQGFINTLVTASGGAMLLPVEIVQAVKDGKSLDLLVNAAQGIANLPAQISDGLASNDPKRQGAALAELAMTVSGGAALTRSLAQVSDRAFARALDNAGAGAEVRFSVGGAASNVANPVADTLARVVPGNLKPTMLGGSGALDVFVTNASELRGLTVKQIAEKLAIPESFSFRVIEFPSVNVQEIASPIGRNNQGFIQGGRTAGGAAEFVIPNGPIPAGATERIVQ